MGRFKLLIEYEGTRYSGWQIQKNSKTVAGKISEAIIKIFDTNKFEFYGSGRTDAGVHALGQTAHLDVKTMLAPHIIRMKINDLLPSDINILSVEKVNPKFHARHDAISRSYIYQISRRRTAFGKNFVWWVKDNLEFNKIESASKLFLGMNDYYSFSDKDAEEKSSKVFVEKVILKEEGDLILIKIIGSHFLWKMVRRIVGVLVEIGRGNLTDKDLVYFLNNKTNEPAKYTAPPSGLFLEKVTYSGEKIDDNIKSIISISNFLDSR